MPESLETRAFTIDAAADAGEQVVKANKDTLNFLFGAQRLLMEETVFASNEALERARVETHLFAEFVSKMAGVHSVKGIREMVEECAQHQIDFLRRDSERVFNHGQRMIETAGKLFSRELDS